MLHSILVVKLGGGAGLDTEACARDLAEIARCRPVVVVHGVSAALDALCAERGVAVRTLTSPSGHSSRYTDAQTRDLFVEASRAVGMQWAAALERYGIAAREAAPCIVGQRKDAVRAVIDGRVRIVRDDYTGVIAGVDTAPIEASLQRGIVPIIPPLASSADGLLNIDGDRAAAAVAAALDASELVILSNVRGLYRDFADAGSLVGSVAQHELPRALDWAAGRMKRKVLGAKEALDGGVRRVVIGDGRVQGAISAALRGAGTEFVR